MKLVSDILAGMERQDITSLVAIDLSTLFDTVDHSIVLEVISKRFGVKDKELSWFSTYLRPRSCKVKVADVYSSERDLPFSVPQGSCAGSVLYLAYAYDANTQAEHITEGIDIHRYADGHALKKQFRPNTEDKH